MSSTTFEKSSIKMCSEILNSRLTLKNKLFLMNKKAVSLLFRKLILKIELQSGMFFGSNLKNCLKTVLIIIYLSCKRAVYQTLRL